MLVVQTILNRLKDFPQVTYDFEKKDFLTVRSKATDQKLSISFWDKEHTLFFGDWHWHFENNDIENRELLHALVDIISNKARLKIFKKNGKTIRCDLELPNDQKNLNEKLTTGFFDIKFWKKPEIEYDIVQFT